MGKEKGRLKNLSSENKRLNMVHAAVVKALRRGQRVEALRAHLAANDVAALTMDGDAPRELRELGLACRSTTSPGCRRKAS